MKRDTAFEKLHILCERFDQSNPKTHDLLPLSAWLFGSVLTDKPEPADIDLLVQFDESKLRSNLLQNESIDVLDALKEFHRAVQAYSNGMKLIHIEALSDMTVATWFRSHTMPLDTPHKLIWQPGMDWAAALDEIYKHPLPHEPKAEAVRKQKKLRGEGRVRPIMQIIRQKLHVEKHISADAVFEPLNIQRGFVVCVTSDACPLELVGVLNEHGYDHTFDKSKRKIMNLGRVYWVWNADGKDIIGLGILLFKSHQAADAEAWIREQINLLWERAKIEHLPVLEVKQPNSTE